MANVTIAIEDEVLKKARLRAVEQGTSVNAVVREFLRDYTGKGSRQADAATRLIDLAHQSRAEVGPATWTRDDIRDREAPHR